MEQRPIRGVGCLGENGWLLASVLVKQYGEDIMTAAAYLYVHRLCI